MPPKHMPHKPADAKNTAFLTAYLLLIQSFFHQTSIKNLTFIHNAIRVKDLFNRF